MTENDAITIIKCYYPKKKKFNCGIFIEVHDTECNLGQALNVAIATLKEIQQYRKIGTVEECRKAVDKQKPKKIIIEPYCPTECPTCGHELSTSLGDGYYKYPTFLKRCPNCGQAIQW